MAAYLALKFPSSEGTQLVLKEWKLREGTSVNQGDTLFIFGEGANTKAFNSQASGIFKAFLWKEGENLEPGCLIGVLQTEEAEAQRLEAQGSACILTPEEAKGGMSYAEAASIRLPPEN